MKKVIEVTGGERHVAAYRHAAIDDVESSRKIDAGQRRPPLAFGGVEIEFDKRYLHPEVARRYQERDTRGQNDSDEDS